MSYVLFVVGFLGFFITNIYLIVQAIKKKFRKKLLLPPLICFILCIVGVMLSPTPDKVSVKTIEISIEKQKAEYDINQTIPVSISVEPSNADISDLTYISSANKSDTFLFSDSKVETGANEGSYEIYIKCGDIESNKLSITVVDAAKKAAQEQAKLEAQQKAQEEAQKQAELLAQQQAEEEARKQAELQAQQQAEAQRQAEEEARKQAEFQAQQQAEAQQRQNTTSSSSTSQKESGGTVYWTPNGEVYHSTPPKMKN
jgi:flagellar biosynthesis GTPase FlhF